MYISKTRNVIGNEENERFKLSLNKITTYTTN